MKNRRYIKIFLLGIVMGFAVNIETLVLQGYETIEEQYMNSIFPFNLFLEHKQYFVSFKIMLISLIYLCLIVNTMKKRQIPYILLRVKNKYIWEYKSTNEISNMAALFYLGITLSIFFMSIFVSDGNLSFLTWKVWFLSWVSLIYLGIILGCFVNLFASFLNAQTAIIITYTFFLLKIYATMKFSDFFLKSKTLLYLNPITALSIVEEEKGIVMILVLLVMHMVGCICQGLLAFVYMRWENSIESEN